MLSLRGISKRFAAVQALDDVSFDLADGEIVAVIGENGAGKSTMMKIIGGVYEPDSGTIELDGEAVQFRSPSAALARGIRVIYQELSVLGNLDIAANIFLGREKRKGIFLNRSQMRAEAKTILDRLGVKLDPARMVDSLSLAECQMVEIARALSMEVKILILDEPTSSLTLEETQNLMRLVKDLKSHGVSVLYVSHRLDEVHQIADRVVALRDGKNAGELKREEISHDAMIRLMVGRSLTKAAAGEQKAGKTRLELKGVRSARYSNESVDLEVREGEILGMAGLVGAGRTELARAVFGIDHISGTVLVDGEAVRIRIPDDAIAAGVYLVPEDRRHQGLTVEMNVRENISMPMLSNFARVGLVNRPKERAYAESAVERMKIRTAGVETRAANLSGGNQQKVVLARWLALQPKVLIFDEPTRGVDVGSKAEIYAEMRKLADSGVAIWMISSDMEEVLGVSDRIVVLHEGRITGTLTRQQASEEAVMTLAVGGTGG